jgi:hypothetical protein
MLPPMTRIFATLATIAMLTPFAALASAPTPLGPNNGQFGDWTAAAYGTGAEKICYAFTKPHSTVPLVPGRGLTMLTITERHGSHDEVSLTPGFTYPKTAVVSMLLGRDRLTFYVQDNVAFTDNVNEALAGFARESAATVTSTGPKGKKFTDTFSLNGFSAAYKAIVRACP